MADIDRLERALINADKAGDTEAAKVIANEIVKIRAQSYQPEPASTGERFARGLAEPVMGAAQLMSRPLAALGRGVNTLAEGSQFEGAGDYLESLPERNDQIAVGFRERSEQMAPDGIDIARFAGNATALGPTIVAGGVPGTMLGLARQGAVTGGVAGATQIAEGENVGRDKVMATGAGAALGAASNPFAAKLFNVIGKGGGKLMARVRDSIGTGRPMQQVRAEIINTMEQAGLDTNALGKAYIDGVARQVKTALDDGGSLDEQALLRQASFKQVGVQGTKGQISRDPIQFSDEMFLRQQKGGERLAEQYTTALTTLNQRIDDMLTGSGKAKRNVEAGQQVFGSLRNIDDTFKKQIDAAYTSARNTNAQVKREGVSGLVESIESALDSADLDMRAAKQVQEELTRLRSLADEMPEGSSVMLKDLEKARRFMNTLRGGMDNDARLAGVAVRAYDRYLAGAPDDLFIGSTKASGSDVAVPGSGESDAVGAFNAARKRAAERFQQLEKLPVLDKLVRGKIEPDDFMRRGIYNAKLENVKQLRAYLRPRDRDAWNQVKVQVIADLKDTATGGSDDVAAFSQHKFNRMLNSLDDSGKLGLLFSPSEISMLRAVGRVGRDVQQAPPGQIATGFAGNAKAMGMLMKLIGQIPGRAGAAARAFGRTAENNLNAERALMAAPVTHPGQSVVPNALARSLGPSVPVGVNALANSE